MSWFLPHLDESPEQRQQDLRMARKRYQYRYDSYVSPLAICGVVPERDTILPRWMMKAGKAAMTSLANRIELEDDPKLLSEHRKRHRTFADKLGLGSFKVAEALHHLNEAFAAVATRTANCVDDYDDLFRAMKLPPIHKYFRRDDVFAWLRLAGPNSVLIERINALPENLPLAEEQFQACMPGDSIDAAASQGRLYVADYRALTGVGGSTWQGVERYIYAPLALFAVPAGGGALQPVAIQCEQTPGDDNPIFTPHDGFDWLIAKTILEVADGNFHEAITHLGRTHLLIEPFVVTTYRQLSHRHPLYRLLMPHFEGTLNINRAAVETLIAPQGNVDQVMAPPIESVWKAAVEGVESYLFDQSWLPEALTSRGVDDPELLAEYPYRDDSLLYWAAIRDWVADYLAVYYPSDAEVARDAELVQWFRELAAKDGGRVRGLAGPESLSYLVDVVTMIIFTASCQHAAVNFPQWDVMAYVPCMPGACYRPRPTERGNASEQDWLEFLPPLDQAEVQSSFLYILGTVHYTKLGHYPPGHFEDRQVKSSLRQFRSRIQEAGAIIEKRNEERILPYDYLLPRGIPQSINI